MRKLLKCFMLLLVVVELFLTGYQMRDIIKPDVVVDQVVVENREYLSLDNLKCGAEIEISSTGVSDHYEYPNEYVFEVVVKEVGYKIVELVDNTLPDTNYIGFTYSCNEEDFFYLCKLVQAEGGIESYLTKKKIASVVLNRVMSKGYPDTIQGVINQESQFSVMYNGMFEDSVPTEDTIRAVRDVLDNGTVLPIDVRVFATTKFFETHSEGWTATREIYDSSDNTTFAYDWKRPVKEV